MSKPTKTIRIDVTKIDKTAIYQGEKGKYLTLCLWDKPDQYGNAGYVTQDLGKERREAGDRSEFLGNWKDLEQPREVPAGRYESAKDIPVHEGKDDIPF